MCIILHLKNTKISAVTHKLADILQIKHSRARERHAAALEFNSFNHLSSHLAGGNNVSARLDDYLERLGSLLGEHHNLVLTGAMKAAIEAEMSSSLESLYRTAQIEDFIKYALIAGSDSISIEVFGRFVAEVSSFVEFVDYDEIFAQTLSTGVVGDELTDYFNRVRSVLWPLLETNTDKVESNFSFEDMVPKYKAMMESLGSARLVHLYELPLMGAVEQSGASLVARDSIRIGTEVREAFGQFVDSELYGADKFVHVNRIYDLGTKHLKKHVAQYRNPARLKPLDNVLLQGALGGVVAPFNVVFFPLFMPVGVAVYRRDGDEIEQRKQNSFPALPIQSGGAVGCYIYQLAVIGREPTKKMLGLAHAAIEQAIKVSCNDNASMMALGRFVEYEGFSSSRSKLFGEMFSTWCIDYPDTTIMISNSEMGILTEISQEGIVSPYGNEPHAVAVACGRSTDMFFDVDRHVYFNNRLQPIINHFRKTSSFNPKILDTYYEYLPVEGSGSADRHFRNVVVKDISDPRDFVRSLPFEKCRNVNVSMLDCLDWDAPIIFMGFDENGVQCLNATYYPFYASYEPEFYDKMAPLYNEIVKRISGYMFKFENEVMSVSYNGITCSLDPSWTEEEMAVGHFNMNMADIDEAGYLPRYDVWIRLVPSDDLVIDENIAKRVRQAINHGELHLKLALNAKNNSAIAKALDEAHNKDVYSHITDINEVKLAPSIPDGLQEYHEEGCIWFKARTVNTIFTPFGKKVDISLPKQSPELGNIHIVQLIKGFSQ